LSPKEKRKALKDTSHLFEDVGLHSEIYEDAIKQESDLQKVERDIDQGCNLFSPPLFIDETMSYSWIEDRHQITLSYITNLGITVSIQNTGDELTGSITFEGAHLHSFKSRSDITSTSVLRIFCSLISGYGFKRFLVEDPEADLISALQRLHERRLLYIVNEDPWTITCVDIIEDPKQSFIF